MIYRLMALAALVFPLASYAAGISDLSWLEGNWKETSKAGIFECHFSSADGQLILGSAKLTGVDGTVSFYELNKIEMVNGDIQLTPYPFGKQGVTFTAIEVSGTKVVFENAAHDFPRRITYFIHGDGNLVLHVEGVNKDGTSNSQIFVLSKYQPPF